MLKAIVASFIGTLLALVPIGILAVITVDSTIDSVVDDISARIEQGLVTLREQASSAATHLREMTGAGTLELPEALEDREALLVAFGQCVERYADDVDRPAEAVERCLEEFEPVEP